MKQLTERIEALESRQEAEDRQEVLWSYRWSGPDYSDGALRFKLPNDPKVIEQLPGETLVDFIARAELLAKARAGRCLPCIEVYGSIKNIREARDES